MTPQRRSARGQPHLRQAAGGALALALAMGATLAPVSVARAGESVFSLQFLGFQVETSDPRARGMGTLGIAIDDAQTALTLNPASMAALHSMTLSLMGGGIHRTSRDGSLEEKASVSSFPHLRVALPVGHEVVLSLGLLSLRHYRSGFTLPPGEVAALAYHYEFERDGSLYEIPIGIAGALGTRVHLGATLDVLLGTVEESWTTRGDSLLALRTRRRDEMDGVAVTLGGIVRATRFLRLGASWSTPAGIDLITRTTIEDARIGVTSALRDTIVGGRMHLPGELRLGAAAELGPAWLVAADWQWRDWAHYEGRLYGAESVGTETRLGGGLEYHPTGKAATSRLAYRLGVSRSTWPQRLRGETVNETTVHAGTGMRLRGDAGRLDLAVEYTRAGDLGRNGFEEKRWSFWLALDGQEIWRRKSPRGK